MKKAIILGGGFTGFIWAHLLAKRGWTAVILEKENVVGGGIRTLWHNGHPYTHGPRHFITKNDKAFEYINDTVPQRLLKHHTLTYAAEDDRFYVYPLHADDQLDGPDADAIRAEIEEAKTRRKAVPENMEDKWLNGIGPTLYRKFIDKYTRKHWGVPTNTVLDDVGYSGIFPLSYGALRTGTRQMLADCIVSYPISIKGWDDYFDKVAAGDGITVRTGVNITGYDLGKKTIHIGDEKLTGDLIVSSLSPDVISDNAYGPLPYAGRTMSCFVLPIEQIFPDDLYFLYYAGDEPFLRIVEYKKLTGYKSPNTLLGIEYPAVGPRDYPFIIKSEVERANRYIANLPRDVLSVGRQGTYRYLNIGDIVEDALERVKDY